MLVYGIVNKKGDVAVDQTEQLILFRTKKACKKIPLDKGERIQIFEVRESLDGRRK
jgi:hypothetical protein